MRESSKYQFIDGIYKVRIFDSNPNRVYVVTGQGSMKVFRLAGIKKGFTVNSASELLCQPSLYCAKPGVSLVLPHV